MSFQYHALSEPYSIQSPEVTGSQLPPLPRSAVSFGEPQHHHHNNNNGAESHETLLNIRTSQTFETSGPTAHHKVQHGSTVPKDSTCYEPSSLPPLALRATLMSWALEICAMMLSIGSIIAIIAVLYRENDKSLDRWSLAVSLNTVVYPRHPRENNARFRPQCLHGLVAFERFDEAVRGPWGGTRLFIWLRARHWAALGALVIMGTIAFDPFLQAVISSQGRLDETDHGSNTTISQARRMDTGTFTVLNSVGILNIMTSAGAMTYMPVRTRPDFGLVGSIYNGLRNTSISREEPVSFTCISGNCTWPVFASAAVCSSCADVSAHLNSTTAFGRHGTSIPWGQSNAWMSANFTSWQVPNGEIRNYHGLSNTLPGGIEQSTLMTLNTTTIAAETQTFQDYEALLMAFTFLRAPADYVNRVTTWEESKPSATECAWYLCANAYQAVSINNELNETLVGSWSQKKPDSYGPDSTYEDYNTKKGLEIANAAAADLGTQLYDSSVIRTDLQLEIPSKAAKSLGLQDERFNISQTFIFSTISYLEQITHKPGVWDSNNLTTRKYIPGSDTVGWPSLDSSMPAIADAFWNSTNLTNTFENVARSITLQLRNTSPDRHPGTLQNWVIHVRVDWWYLTFPIAMLALGLVYVTLVIIESTQLRIPVWKESARPTLLYGFHDETQRLLREETSDKRSLTTVRYRMDEKEDCLRLVADRMA
ncbi:hypothetical protein BU25DRAFT_423841 [Macroventuria anomochaeta]|uniref:Uncharacterized protein n=1 Tax=Macroventuria anomochaeta TaxID=301207 RepID=A0ACB6RS52_9PLEO|nr:uncharacterized protein BU25DRAFT_423841 [Macroventuria anomochaeta]KAF2624731.1 hypothetical protein BU25DRAFT_423841 [Macroventuria anomochaeta]